MGTVEGRCASTFTANDTRKLEVTHIFLQLVERLVRNFGILPVRKHSKHFAGDAKPEPEPARQFLGTRAGARGHLLPQARAEQQIAGGKDFKPRLEPKPDHFCWSRSRRYRYFTQSRCRFASPGSKSDPSKIDQKRSKQIKVSQ